MAHNFKLTGDYYVSVDGSDSNNGLTKDTPKRTVQAGLNLMTTSGKTLIIGAGVYRESISFVQNINVIIYIKGDGKVIFEGNQSNRFYLSSPNGTGISFIDNIEFRGYLALDFNYFIGDNNLSNCIIKCNIYTNAQNTSYKLQISNSIILNTFLYSNITLCYLYNCIVVNSNINSSTGVNPFSGVVCSTKAATILKDSVFINSAIGALSTITAANFNYNNFYNNSTIIMTLASTVTSGTVIDFYGKYYNLAIATSTGTGTIGDPFGRPFTNGAPFAYDQHKIAYPTYNVNSIASDPLFNSIEAQDFTLQATSPCLGKASDGTNIGGTKYALRYAATGDAFNTSAVSISNLALSASNWIVSGGTTGEVISAPILISSVPKVLQKITYNGQLEFDKLITPGTAGNRNVPDQEVYDSTVQPPNVAGANPDRLVYYLRYSTQASQPTADAQWDNGGYWTAGNYNTFEWNTKPGIDSLFVGNGAPTFNSAVTPTYLNVTWIQLKVKLRNDYA
jgi:hypothetical protein